MDLDSARWALQDDTLGFRNGYGCNLLYALTSLKEVLILLIRGVDNNIVSGGVEKLMFFNHMQVVPQLTVDTKDEARGYSDPLQSESAKLILAFLNLIIKSKCENALNIINFWEVNFN